MADLPKLDEIDLDTLDFGDLAGSGATAAVNRAGATPHDASHTPPLPAHHPAALHVETSSDGQGAYLTDLFDRVNKLLCAAPEHHPEGFVPREPESLDATGLTLEEIEKLMFKFLLARGTASGRRVAQQVCLSFNLVEPLLKGMKAEQLVAYRGSATMGDYEYQLTDTGRERARRYVEENTYFGACPVALKDYLAAMGAQSIAKQQCCEDDLRDAFSDLIINQRMFDKLGPAINSGRGMFLFGEPATAKRASPSGSPPASVRRSGFPAR